MTAFFPMLGYFGNEMVTVDWLQGTDGSYVDGVWVQGAKASTPIRIISPQPVTPNDLVQLEGGEHLANFVKTWTENLDVFTRGGNKDPDHIVWDGDTYQITQVAKRKLGSYRKTIMKRLG